MFDKLMEQSGIPAPVREYRFHPTRKWRADYAWPKYMLILEVEGGIWKRGRHNRAVGFKKDMEKYNAASRMGYTLLRYTPDELMSRAINELRDFFDERDLSRASTVLLKTLSSCSTRLATLSIIKGARFRLYCMALDIFPFSVRTLNRRSVK